MLINNSLCFGGSYLNNNLYKNYHNNEWGKPIYCDQKLFECLSLEVLQAGLSWVTILKKRSSISQLLYNFDIDKISSIDNCYIESIINNKLMIRHRAKIKAIINNAQMLLELKNKGKTFSSILWSCSNYKILDKKYKNFSEIPCQDNNSENLAKYLKSLGLVFIGSKLCYSLMESCGIYNNHIVTCINR